LLQLNVSRDDLKNAIRELSQTLDYKDFDNKFLKPKSFKKLCNLLDISPNRLYDGYYSFIFSDYSKILIKARQERNLNQKQLSKILNISPVDFGMFERSQKYPSRNQYKKLIILLRERMI
jgi:predicted transcriptional regulator